MWRPSSSTAVEHQGCSENSRNISFFFLSKTTLWSVWWAITQVQVLYHFPLKVKGKMQGLFGEAPLFLKKYERLTSYNKGLRCSVYQCLVTELRPCHRSRASKVGTGYDFDIGETQLGLDWIVRISYLSVIHIFFSNRPETGKYSNKYYTIHIWVLLIPVVTCHSQDN